MNRSVQLNPVGSLSLLSQLEVDSLKRSTSSELYQIFRNCCLAVLNSGADDDDFEHLFAPYANFDVNLLQRERGVKIELINPPERAFVDDELITGVHEHLFAVLRDMLHMGARYENFGSITESTHITHMVFDMLRNAEVIRHNWDPNMVVCWGGHSIGEVEYRYTKEVGYQLGLRQMNICTGCGPGAMKGPMKGATIGHAKQRYKNGRYLGITEPSIIAAEPPNPIVNELVIMPDIEKRLEAFVRAAHGIVIFPGGVGTAEELLYLLGIMLHEKNSDQVLPIVLTGPKACEEYFKSIDQFVATTLGAEAQKLYTIIVDDPVQVARTIKQGQKDVRDYRKQKGDSYHFNWSLHIDDEFQFPFQPTHERMAALNLHFNQPKAQLAAALRRAFSGIVAGNVKAEGVKQIRDKGPFQINGDIGLMKMLDELLESFVKQNRMKLPGSHYSPCYQVSKVS
ncbi:nucleotide 5'-monophosphate nucleosidase PpnN [Aliiglaciecola sp. CAU 1673]|uniref:nucleotide 5'-monophosphate nucleosidase PpnN n=1 Tax=Aliiglaciecola sp. CAU 1673 TaxID=3032595 RepID=UPI0023DBD173|nr:nucleotide 5'-monophosphate nucleosidase PpnN [Aliiglaciecola sp. CAU 1673]MDF2179642.1 nucleotide 5'-monophosphate nucleosidase PpnN [Aliiglaciecola sp. CAU 1673]